MENPSTSGGHAFTQKSQPLHSRLVTCTHGNVGGTGNCTCSLILSTSSLIGHCEETTLFVADDRRSCEALAKQEAIFVALSPRVLIPPILLYCRTAVWQMRGAFGIIDKRWRQRRRQCPRRGKHWGQTGGSQRQEDGFVSKSGPGVELCHDERHFHFLGANPDFIQASGYTKSDPSGETISESHGCASRTRRQTSCATTRYASCPFEPPRNFTKWQT